MKSLSEKYFFQNFPFAKIIKSSSYLGIFRESPDKIFVLKSFISRFSKFFSSSLISFSAIKFIEILSKILCGTKISSIFKKLIFNFK